MFHEYTDDLLYALTFNIFIYTQRYATFPLFNRGRVHAGESVIDKY